MSAEEEAPGAGVGAKKVLTDATFDTFPTPDFEDVTSGLPSDTRIGIGTPERFGMDPTVEKTVSAAEEGYHPVPHLVARFIEDDAELERIANELRDAGVDEIFVVGGDCNSPWGEFSSAYELLEALEELGYSFDEVGIGGHPSGHDTIPEETLMESLDRKQSYATYIVTQMCLEASTIVSWTESIRDRGIDLPIEVGIPGVVDYRKIISYAREWGIAKPFQFLQKTTGVLGFVWEFLRHRGRYVPDRTVRQIAPYFEDDDYNFDKSRLYTFNQVSDTERWRHTFLDG